MSCDFVKELQEKRRSLESGNGVQASQPKVKVPEPPPTPITHVKLVESKIEHHEDIFDVLDESLLRDAMITAPVSRYISTKKNGSLAALKYCGCMALDHEFMRNCIKCGRIVCVQEDDRVCPECGFGGNLKEDKAELNRYKELEGYQAACELRDRLLQFDMESAKRTRVYDMETDFYSERYNPWATAQERAFATKQDEEEESFSKDPNKLLGELNIDIQNMKLSMTNAQEAFVDAQNSVLEKFLNEEPERFQAINDKMKSEKGISTGALNTPEEEVGQATGDNLKDDLVEGGLARVVRDSEAEELVADVIKNQNDSVQVFSKAQIGIKDRQYISHVGDDDQTDGMDGETAEVTTCSAFEEDTEFVTPAFPEESDEGICLTLHQPWASLIVYGFKRLEGRVWNTNYRGRIWIHAGTQEVSEDVIKQIEGYYRTVYGGSHCPECQACDTGATCEGAMKWMSFPPNYPTRCLVGHADLIDVIENDEDKLKFPWVREQNDSPYMFVLKNPRRLITPIAMPGQHKFWKLHRPQVYYRNRTSTAYPKVYQHDLRLGYDTARDHDMQQADCDAAMVLHIKSQYEAVREILLSEVPRVFLDSVTLNRGYREHLKFDIVKIRNGLEPADLKLTLAAVVTSIEQSPISEDLGAGGENTVLKKDGTHGISTPALINYVREKQLTACQHQLVSSSTCQYFASRSVHIILQQLFDSAWNQLAGAGKTGFSVGGPHLPPVDLVELVVTNSEEHCQFLSPISSLGNPIVIAVFSGVIKFGPTPEIVASAGDVLWIPNPSTTGSMTILKTSLSPEETNLVGGSCFTILRANTFRTI